jgi:ATP-dependent helicase/DNAse subunit B
LQNLFPDDQAFSPSELETYAACPFRYFGSRVLRLAEREPEQTRLHYGMLVHRVLQAFYEERRRALALTDLPQPALAGKDDRQRLLELFRQEWEQVEDGFLAPDLEFLFSCEEGVLDLFLGMIQAIEGQPGDYGNLKVEYQVPSLRLGEDERSRPVYLTGKIDRLDVRRKDRRQAAILDYKTGRKPRNSEQQAKTLDGRLLQLQLYALAVKLLHPELDVVGGAYLHLYERQKSREEGPYAALSLAGKLWPDAEPAISFDLEAASRHALELAGEIRSGNFSLTKFADDKHTECTAYCPLRHACRHPGGYRTPFYS